MSAFQLAQHAPPALQLALRLQQQALDLRQLRTQRAAGQSTPCRM